MISYLLLALAASLPQTSSCPDTTDVAAFVARFMITLPKTERPLRGAFVLVCSDRPAYATGFGKRQSGTPIDPALVFRR